MSNEYWFKRRRYGYGWVPVTKKGWGVLALFIIVLVLGAFLIKDVPDNQFTKEVGAYLITVLVLVVVLVRITAAKGPAPKWRWGKKPTDNPEEDW